MNSSTSTTRGLVIAAAVASLVAAGAVAASGTDGPAPWSIDPTQAEVTVTDEASTLDGTPTETSVTTYDVGGRVLDRSVRRR